MDQNTRWLNQYEELVTFMETNKRRPSKYVDSERGMHENKILCFRRYSNKWLSFSLARRESHLWFNGDA